MDNYVIILFKNKKKKKIIKGYSTETNAKNKFGKMLKDNNVSFPVYFENGESCNFELGLLTNQQSYQPSLFTTDNIGRNTSVKVEGNSEYVFLKIDTYLIEEKIYDWQKEERIYFNDLIKDYCKMNVFKNIYTLNNKLIIQADELFSIFSLKNNQDSVRLLDTIENYYRNNNRSDAMFVKDVSTIQRKWIYDLLESNGFDRKKLYRQTTTFSRRN